MRTSSLDLLAKEGEQFETPQQGEEGLECLEGCQRS